MGPFATSLIQEMTREPTNEQPVNYLEGIFYSQMYFTFIITFLPVMEDSVVVLRVIDCGLGCEVVLRVTRVTGLGDGGGREDAEEIPSDVEGI